MFRDNVIAIQSIDPKDIPINDLKPRQQEEAGNVLRLFKYNQILIILWGDRSTY